MPRNAANKDVFRVVGGVTTKARFVGAVAGSRQSVNASCRITNDSFDTIATLKFQSVPQGRDEIQRIVLAATGIGGSFTISWDGYTTAAIQWHSLFGTFQNNVQNALDAMLATRGLAAGSITAIVPTASHTANGSTINLRFNGQLGQRAWAGTTTARTITTNIGSLSGITPTSTVTTPTAGFAPGQGPASDITPDGKSSATITVQPRGSISVAFGTDSDSNNELGPDFWVVGLTGNVMVEMEHDASSIHFLGGNA